MLKEIYLRDSSDPLYVPYTLEISSELENLLGQIRMILFTKPGDVIGTYNFGFNLEDMIFSTTLNQSEIKVKLLEMISSFCPDAGNFNLNVDISFFQGSVRDACLIDIYIDNTKQFGVLVK